MDISGTVNALKRAALLILEMAGGSPASQIADVYPDPGQKKEVTLQYAYLKKLSGKAYTPDAVKNILQALGFGILDEEDGEIRVSVPWHKPDIGLPADLVEEIMRIDGLDNIAIPATITISPAVESGVIQADYKTAVAHYLVGQGFCEILTNSITNSAYFSESELSATVKMINNLSAELDVLRHFRFLETGLESIGYNLNRKTTRLRFFEFGKTYRSGGVGKYSETNRLGLYLTGPLQDGLHWEREGGQLDIVLRERSLREAMIPPVVVGWKKRGNGGCCRIIQN